MPRAPWPTWKPGSAGWPGRRDVPMSTLFGRLKETIQAQAERHRNRPFMAATMAASALVAYADGTVTFSERSRMDQILESLEQLKVFDPHEAVNLFNEMVEAMQADAEAGRAAALARIAPFAEDKEAAQLMVRIAAAISEADGDFSASERARIDEICAALGTSYEDCVA